MCSRWNIIKAEWRDDLVANHYCTYPSDMKSLTGMRVSSTPTDIKSFQWVTQYQNEDQFRSATCMSWLEETLPLRYWPDQEVIFLVGKPTATVVDGLRLHGFALATRLATAGGALYEPPDLTSDLCVQRMVIHGKRINKQYQEANAEHEAWIEQGSRFEHQIEFRADDAKQAIRTAGQRNLYGDMS
jgi:hypothetical protein